MGGGNNPALDLSVSSREMQKQHICELYLRTDGFESLFKQKLLDMEVRWGGGGLKIGVKQTYSLLLFFVLVVFLTSLPFNVDLCLMSQH
jgi:hypothetical protein